MHWKHKIKKKLITLGNCLNDSKFPVSAPQGAKEKTYLALLGEKSWNQPL